MTDTDIVERLETVNFSSNPADYDAAVRDAKAAILSLRTSLEEAKQEVIESQSHAERAILTGAEIEDERDRLKAALEQAIRERDEALARTLEALNAARYLGDGVAERIRALKGGGE